MKKRFESKVVLVTGATSGLGRHAAHAFACEGAKVVVSGRRDKEGQETVSMIQADGGEATYVKADLSRPEEVHAMVVACEDCYGGLDLAFNNAGIDGTMRTSLVDYDLETWNQVMAVNLTGMFLSMKYEIELMLKRGGGAIVNMGAVASKKPSANVGVAYVTSKHAIVGLTLNGAVEYADKGIRVNAVCPAIIRSGMSEKNSAVSQQMEQRAREVHAMGRIGEPSEVSNTVMWLCSDEASFITGAVIPVDGGFLLK